MGLHWTDGNLLNQLRVGLSIVTWLPEDPGRMEWVFINDARCKMTGFSREEILSKPPISQTSRETRAIIQKTNEMIEEHGRFTSESTLLDKSNTAIPVKLVMSLVDLEEGRCLLTEHHDIRAVKEAESQLERSRESAQEMLSLIDRGKQQLTRNIQDNLELVLTPLIDQLRVTATGDQSAILDFMTRRVSQFAQEIGVAEPIGAYGANLTRRQILICEMIRDGMTSKELALALGCSPSTINNHRNIIRKKLKLSGKADNLQAFLNRRTQSED